MPFFHRFSFKFLILAILAAWFWQSVEAFPAIDFSRKTDLAKQYENTVNSYESKYDSLKKSIPSGQISARDARRLAVIEKNIAQAYKNLADALTSSAKTRQNILIRRFTKSLDREIVRISKAQSKNLAANVTMDPSLATVSAQPTPVPVQPVSQPTWENATSANFLYYADQFEGGGTSNGNIFHQAGFSAARCNIDLNTLVQLRSGDTGVIVKVNDRPNCSKYPDIVDLTRTAFSTLAPLSRGRIDGQFVTLGKVSNSLVKEFLPTEYFSNLNVRLDSNIPNMYLPGESFEISGTTTNGSEESLIYLVYPSGKVVSYGQESVDNGRFQYLAPLTEVGDYSFVLAAGRSFSWAKGLRFSVLDPALLDSKQYFNPAPVSSSVKIATERTEASDLSPTELVTVSPDLKNMFRSLTITSSGASITRTGMDKLAFFPNELSGFKDGDVAQITVTARTSSTPYSMDTMSTSAKLFDTTLALAPLYRPERNIDFIASNDNGTLHLKITAEVAQKIHADTYIITPKGKVEIVKFAPSYVGSDGFLNTTNGATLSYQMTEVGVYLVEVNYDSGFAAIIEPMNNGNVLAILPNAYDFTDREIDTNADRVREQTLASINQVRTKAGLSPVVLDTNLWQVAQAKAQDMADNNYVGHRDSQGGFIIDTAKRIGIRLRGSIGENVAGGTVGASFLQAGLSLSGAHRSNMLGSSWTKVGLGIVAGNGKVSLVEVFGE